MHADQLAVPRVGKRLGVHHTHQQRADEARPLRHRHRVDGAPGESRLGERAVHHRRQGSEVRPTGELRHHPAEHLVYVLGEDDEAGELGAPVLAHEDGGRCLVAGRLDAQNDVSHVRSSA